MNYTKRDYHEDKKIQKCIAYIHVSSKLRKPGFIEIKLQTIEVHLPDRHIHNKINVQPRLVMLVIQELNFLYLSFSNPHLYLPISDLFFQSLNKPVPNTSVNFPKPKLLSAAWSVISKTFSPFSHNQSWISPNYPE